MKIWFATWAKQSDAAVEMRNTRSSDGDEIPIVSVVDRPCRWQSTSMAATCLIRPTRKNRQRSAQTLTSQELPDTFRGLNLEINTEVLWSPESRIVETAEAIHPDIIV